jgi:DNA-binding LacI/PurR family transcriptional regulator
MTLPRPPKASTPMTIAVIAGEVGVSVTTVSKVLNGRADVAPDTRARVEASLRRNRYRRRVRRQPAGTGRIDLVFHEYESAWAMEIIRGVDAVAAGVEVGVGLSHLDGRHRPSERWLDAALARRPLGMLFVLCTVTDAQRRRLDRQRIPFVVVDSDSATSASVPTVGANNWNGGLLATRHLIELGHRRIAVVAGPEDVLCSRARVAGFRSAHEEAGLPVDPALVRYGNFHVGGGYEHAMCLFGAGAGAAGAAGAGGDRPTAIFAGSDMQAMGVYRAARQLGLDIPGDLSVIGYDNLPVAAWIGPGLTTVNQPLRDMAGTATRILLDLVRGVEPPTSRIDFVTELVVRESTAPPARR